jgi:molybdate transport system regulatory protein
MTKRKRAGKQHGARNQLTGKVTSIQRGDVMSLVKFEIAAPGRMASVITSESLDEMGLKVGQRVGLLVKAVHVLPIEL